MNRGSLFTVVSLVLGVSLTACGGGDSTPGVTLSTTGFDMPTEISAVPTSGSGGGSGGSSSLKSFDTGSGGFRSKVFDLMAATDPGTDYSKAVTTKFVEEPALEQFNIIEQILKAVAQTHYGDPANLNQGPYKAMVAWQEEQNGIETKMLQPWVVDSAMILENGQGVNRLRAWIEEPEDDGSIGLIKAEFKITQAATKKSDGSYQDYGVWTLNVKFNDAATDFFAASASVGSNGESILKIHENFPEQGFNFEVKAIMHKSDTSGFGKVSFPDWESCSTFPCTPTATTAKYAYNAAHLAVQKGASAVQYKDRSAVTDMTHRYGLFDGVSGDDVFKTKSFGFPIRYTDGNGNTRFAYYGAWQGRHEIWAGGGPLTPGTVVTREDRGEGQTAESYTTSALFKGTLTKRTPVTADLNDVLNIPVETWINDNFMIQWVQANTRWEDQGSNPYTDFANITYDANNPRKHINISRWDSGSSMNVNYVYLSASDPNATSGAGFYTVTFNQDGSVSIGSLYTPTDGDQLWVNVGGSIYIEYKGAGPGWVQKKLLSFDQRTWTPEFDPAGDQAYTLPLDVEIYINSKGANYIVKRTSGGTEVKIELQSVANPVSAGTFVPANTVFMAQWATWGDTAESTYEFVTNSADPNFLKLVYKTIGSNDTGLLNEAGNTISVGDVVNQGFWGLMAYDNVGTPRGSQFNWDYPRQGETWGTLQYLKDSNNAFVLLSDPIQMDPVTLTNNGGASKTLSLQYDGWMHGLPDLFEELRKKNFVMDATISDKIINIPAGTAVTDSLDANKSYLIKPLEVSQFLNIVSDPGNLDITQADSVDLNTVPNFVEHNMGAMPTVGAPKYSEGKLIQ